MIEINKTCVWAEDQREDKSQSVDGRKIEKKVTGKKVIRVE